MSRDAQPPTIHQTDPEKSHTAPRLPRSSVTSLTVTLQDQRRRQMYLPAFNSQPLSSPKDNAPNSVPGGRGGALRWWGVGGFEEMVRGVGGWGGGRSGFIGSWVGLTWSHSCQHWQWVVGERHAGRPRLGGQGAEIEFPRLL